ncbi:hypothetical protein MPK66_gp259 [Erwinia phage pEa_SNUABM_2]|uniref:Uncharacterized protein n=1 Tax=Erwinia phage pEa_SNUABM_2 TaxID=2869547 RepID=A0AAE8C4M4_9CAUD|nr:hypothetical protein MPK66_gp259 [Erwinia phage pEa_SNUABM_2]QZE59503.1 hypothetical protein pEaSNUABM2_00259 [Erwinia phage pEa_SNUABM_2]QZE59839.1 hypothetical protein pEaSNUABM39_00259 [Erwinia phage pEa_SNUABM_39]
MTTIGASLGARFAATSSERCSARKKAQPRNKTLTAATTADIHKAVERLSIKLNLTRSNTIELAIKELCAKHGIAIGEPDGV